VLAVTNVNARSKRPGSVPAVLAVTNVNARSKRPGSVPAVLAAPAADSTHMPGRRRPLHGVRVVVTRPERQAAGLVAAFAAAGARVEELPLLAVVPPADPAPLEGAVRAFGAGGRVGAAGARGEVAAAGASGTGGETAGRGEDPPFDWVAFTSANAVDALFDRLTSPLPPGLRAAVVGPATAAALRRRGAEPDRIAARRDAEGLIAELAPLAAARRAAGRPPLRVLLPQAADARPALAAGLAAAGAEVAAVVAYDKRLPADAPARARAIFGDDLPAPAAPLGWVTFTSPRVVDHFVALFGPAWAARRSTLRAASIGPVTTRALVRHGVAPAAEAATPADRALVEAVVAAR
jgi:uroporphyrinogen-III synthase